MVDTATMDAKPASAAAKESDEICIVDLGRQSRRRIKRLRRGQGLLMRKVQRAIEALKEEGVVAGAGSVMVLLVREKPSMASFLDSDDDDDEDDDDDDDDD